MGEIRSIIPKDVRVMVLTATATRSTRVDILKMLGMKKCVVIARSPHKWNIKLHVKEKPDLSDMLNPIVSELKEHGILASRMIIYCRRYHEVTTVYRFLKRKLGAYFTVPRSALDLPGFRLVDMYTNEVAVKESIVDSFF